MSKEQPPPIHRRVFVVGCSRSGTTLLQGLLAAHSRICTFPETGFFLKVMGMRGRVLPWVHLGLTAGKERKSLRRLLRQMGPGPGAGQNATIGQGDGATLGPWGSRDSGGPADSWSSLESGSSLDFGGIPELPPRRVLLRRSVADAVLFFDELARGRGADVWVEKTPRHVFHAARIQRLVDRSVCLHVVRDGRDVVASIVDRARRFPHRFPGQEQPAYGIRQWNRSMVATRAAMREAGHIVVPYLHLASATEVTLRALCPAVGVEYEPGMMDRAPDPTFITEAEEWKAPVTGPIAPALSKFEEIFDEDTRGRIQSRLGWEFFREIERRTSAAPGGIWVSGSAS